MVLGRRRAGRSAARGRTSFLAVVPGIGTRSPYLVTAENIKGVKERVMGQLIDEILALGDTRHPKE